MQQQVETATQRQLGVGDMVLVVDPYRRWTDRPDHTYVGEIKTICRFSSTWTYTVTRCETGERVEGVRADYMRLLPVEEAMRHIDCAPLAETDPTSFPSAAAAWLRQQAAAASSD